MKGKISHLVLILVFGSGCTVAYAAVINEVVHQTADITIPLIFNGIAPIAVLGFAGKKYLDHIKEIHKELIDSKNAHADRIKGVEDHIRYCPNCPKE